MKWPQLPALEYGLTHPHPRGQLFLSATVVIFLLMLPLVVLINVATVGSELVPSLQPHFKPNETFVTDWWGNNKLPSLLRPKTPKCQPKDLGRGDSFRLSGSLFDYTVMSTWNTSDPASDSRIQQQKRAEYRDESFADCYVSTIRFEYSLVDETQTLTAGVTCPGTPDYPIFISMETKIVFALELTKDFIGQYYGPGLNLMNITDANSNDYRKQVLAALEVISSDSLAIIGGGQLSIPVLSMTLFFSVNNITSALNPEATTLTYINGTKGQWPDRANIYATTVTNIVHVVNDAVNLDLGNRRYQNMFTNSSILKEVVFPNLAPPGVRQWVNNETQSFYYGSLNSSYSTWAQALLAGWPVKLGDATGLPENSTMTTSYLCPVYQKKSTSSLLSSVFVGSATMTLSVWAVWMTATAFLAKKIMAPQVICDCNVCKAKRGTNVSSNAEQGNASPAQSEKTGLVEAASPPERPKSWYAKHLSWTSWSTGRTA